MNRAPAGRGLLAGLLSGAVAIGVGQLVAGIVAPASSPVAEVGEMAIGYTPPTVKAFAISTFGSHDKFVLVCGILAVLAVFAAILGTLAVRRLWYGMAGLAVLTVIGVVAAATRPVAAADDVLPTLVGGAAAAVTLALLVRVAREETERWSAAQAPRTPRPTARPRWQPPSDVPLPWAEADAPPRSDDAAQEGKTAEPDEPGKPGTAAQEGKTAKPDEPGKPDAAAQPDDTLPPADTGSPSVPLRPARALPWTGGPVPRTGRATAPARPERRRFLAASAAAAGAAAVAGLAGRVLAERFSVAQAQATLRIPAPKYPGPALPVGSQLHIPGIAQFITPNAKFYRVDTAIVLPEVPPQSWQLRIHGLVAREITLNFDDLIHRPLNGDYITLTCVSNPVGGPYISNAHWIGASLPSLLREAGIRAGASQLLSTSVDGFTVGTPVETVMDGRDAMLAVAMNGTVLPVAHGFPVRMVVPGLYGYVSACKWITDIEVTTFEAAAAYWVTEGWAQQAPIKTESRIDVPTGLTTIQPGRTAVAGEAWAQHKGIEAVEARVDRGPWNEARLAAVPDLDCWRQWVWEWDATPGTHLIEARATDKTGYTQTAVQAPPPPNGASGYPSVTVTVDKA
jgi:DMSO/TMAO reductase YedYZ molybdopterin-dependent catalytic subunit